MNIKKPQTFSKRKRIDTVSDSYLLTTGMNGMAACTKCHAVFSNKRWTLNKDIHQENIDNKRMTKVLCPACRKVKDKFPGGILKLKGEFLAEHKKEILNLIKNEEQRAKGFNPLERIMNIDDRETRMVITTTNEKLAQRIGRSLQKAYHGRVCYKWSDDTKLLRAEWER